MTYEEFARKMWLAMGGRLRTLGVRILIDDKELDIKTEVDVESISCEQTSGEAPRIVIKGTLHPARSEKQ